MKKKRSAMLMLLGSFTIFISIGYYVVNHLNASDAIADLICLATLICGIGILCLANWARVALILFLLGFIIYSTIYLINDIRLGIFSNIAFVTGIILFLGGIIFYLTHPKVKEQFTQKK